MPHRPANVSRRDFVQAGIVGIVSAGAARAGHGTRRQAQGRSRPDPQLASVKVLVFDVFGTVVDWRTSVTREATELAKQKGLAVDGAKFADAWRAGYAPSMNRVRSGDLPWTRLDDLHRLTLDKILIEFGITRLSQPEINNLNHVWRRLQPWPDSAGGLIRLRKKFIIAPLSNGNIALMVNLAKHAGLPWDCILGAELVRRYKPDREVYQSAADFLDLRTAEVMMVAAHQGDLRAAREVGLRTAFVVRPLEFGPEGKPDLTAGSPVDISAKDFNDLADQLGA
jgi:2-haloacid dehalogenase